jgi:hypothetical protein
VTAAARRDAYGLEQAEPSGGPPAQGLLLVRTQRRMLQTISVGLPAMQLAAPLKSCGGSAGRSAALRTSLPAKLTMFRLGS